MYQRNLESLLPIFNSVNFILGSSGSGKTHFVCSLMKKIDKSVKKIIFTQGMLNHLLSCIYFIFFLFYFLIE